MKFKFGLFLISGILFTAPLFAGAAQNFNNPVQTGGFDNPVQTGSSYQPSSGFSNFQLTNPLKVNTVCGLIKSVLQALLVIGLPIAVLFLIFAGLKYVAALGKPEAINEANRNLLYTVISIAIF